MLVGQVRAYKPMPDFYLLSFLLHLELFYKTWVPTLYTPLLKQQFQGIHGKSYKVKSVDR